MSLLDRYLPRWDVRDRHEALVRAAPARAYAVLRALDLERPLVVRALFFLRTLPERWRGGVPPRRPRPFLESALEGGWRILEEDPGRELVMGAATKPWEPVVRFRGLDGPEFVAFEEPGWAKIAWSIGAEEAGPGRTRLAIETRVLTTDAASRRRFRRYWGVFGLGIRLIRVVALAEVRRTLRAGD
ncbi:MAG: hypothetical protein ACM3NW_12195 [Syntrophomonadaceae bacterium]